MFPKLVSLGPIAIHTYGVMAALGLLAGIYLATRLATRVELNRDAIWNLGVYIALAALLGGKVLLFLFDWRYYSAHPREILSWRSLQMGGVYYGGIVFGAAMAYLYARRHQLDFARIADVFAPGLALGTALGRVGCFSVGCCWGKAAESNWAVTFTEPYAARITGVPLDTPLYPVQLYEAAALLAIFAGLLWLWQRRSFDGQIFVAFLLSYAAARFLLEFFRADPRDGARLVDGLTTPQTLQTLSALLFIVAGLYAWQRRRLARSRNVP